MPGSEPLMGSGTMPNSGTVQPSEAAAGQSRTAGESEIAAKGEAVGRSEGVGQSEIAGQGEAARRSEASRHSEGAGQNDRAAGAHRRTLALLVGALAFAVACAEHEPDAYGNFETTQVVISAETAGQLLRFEAEEGERIPAGVVVGLLDTTQTVLQLRELEAQLAAARAQTGQVEAETGALEAQLRLARSELGRSQRLFRDQAATLRRLEQAGSQVEVLQEQLRAAVQQASSTQEQALALVARMAQLRNRLHESRITNPRAGTVLTTYADAGEFVQRGQPLYEIADLDTLILRAYVTGDQLARVRLGQRVRVSVDAGEDALRAFPGVVSWIAAEAEFTPTPIQTREERAALVYALEVRVPNPDGFLKIGMPGEVELDGAGEGALP